MRILGIDPGSRNCGLSIVQTQPLKVLHAESVVLPGDTAESLSAWANHIDDWITKWRPWRIAMESVFFNKNVSSAVKVGEARGVVIALGALHGCQVASYTPQQAKKHLTGDGRAKKDDILKCIRSLHGSVVSRSDHANDASALAICDAKLNHLLCKKDEKILLANEKGEEV